MARRLAAAGKPVVRRALRSSGVRGSNEALNALARLINSEMPGAAPPRARLVDANWVLDDGGGLAAAIGGMCYSRDLAGQRRYVITNACRGRRPAGGRRRYAVRLTVPRRDGWRACGMVRADFERALNDPVDLAVASAEIASEFRSGAGHVRVAQASAP